MHTVTSLSINFLIGYLSHDGYTSKLILEAGHRVSNIFYLSTILITFRPLQHEHHDLFYQMVSIGWHPKYLLDQLLHQHDP